MGPWPPKLEGKRERAGRWELDSVMELSRSIYVHGRGAVGPWDPWPQKREGKKGKVGRWELGSKTEQHQ